MLLCRLKYRKILKKARVVNANKVKLNLYQNLHYMTVKILGLSKNKKQADYCVA